MIVRYTPTAPPLAYAVHGSGAETLFVVPGWASHVSFDWETPENRGLHERLMAGRRIVRYDKRGTGLSERPAGRGTYCLDTRVADLARIMDTVGVERAPILGWSEGGKIALAFAARHPRRVSRLAVFGTSARSLAAPDYPIGGDPAESAAFLALIRAEWGMGSRILAARYLPEADEARTAWFTKWQRVSLTPEAAALSHEANAAVDIRAELSAITAPTLVLHRRGDMGLALSEYLAKHIPNARLEVLDGEHHIPFLGEADALADAVNRFLAEPAPAPRAAPVPGAPACTPLTRREIEVLCLLADGLTDRAIAARLALSDKTVNRHLVNIYTKLGINTRGAAIAHAFRNGYAPL